MSICLFTLYKKLMICYIFDARVLYRLRFFEVSLLFTSSFVFFLVVFLNVKFFPTHACVGVNILPRTWRISVCVFISTNIYTIHNKILYIPHKSIFTICKHLINQESHCNISFPNNNQQQHQ